ncbi:hypothetical protein ES695_14460 [Candidatus Atribacteria bacterium 1244-E10-H5-B2]|nr:MAG: hypothetical protein ES695_14460 [Candidatus Atribacteria bacterium 1244-E10-H5-B2]
MKRKGILVLTFLMLAIFLTGCTGGVVTPLTDEAKIKNVIQEFFLALSDQNWSKVKSYCVYGSEIYNRLVELEEAWNDGVFVIETCGGGSFYVDDINYIVDIGAINTNGEYAEAYTYLTSTLILDNNIIEENYGEGRLFLQRINNIWKLYDDKETM